MNCAEFLIDFLSHRGVKYVFTLPGSHIYPLWMALDHSSCITPIVTCHELSAGYMADGYARSSRTLAVVMTIGGPGSNNLITAVNTARIERVPLLIITGDVPIQLYDKMAFQCSTYLGTNDDALYQVAAKWSRRVSNADQFPDLLHEAVSSALSYPQGPSHLIIPYDIQQTPLSSKILSNSEERHLSFNQSELFNGTFETTLQRVQNLLSSKVNIALWVGETMNTPDLASRIEMIARKAHIPVLTTFSAKGVISESHPLCFGNFGYAGSPQATHLLRDTRLDALIGLDVVQNERNTLGWNPVIYSRKECIFLSSDRESDCALQKHSYCLDLSKFLEKLVNSLVIPDELRKMREAWVFELQQTTSAHSLPKRNGRGEIQSETLEIDAIVRTLRDTVPKNSILVVDSGTHRVFAGACWRSYAPSTFFSASMVAPMGWGIAAGIGVKLARAEPVVVFTGDGCLLMHGTEIKTAVKYRVPLLFVVSNNHGLGNVHIRLKKNGVRKLDTTEIRELDVVGFAKSMGAAAYRVTSLSDFQSRVTQALGTNQVTVLDVPTSITPRIPEGVPFFSIYA